MFRVPCLLFVYIFVTSLIKYVSWYLHSLFSQESRSKFLTKLLEYLGRGLCVNASWCPRGGYRP